MRRKCGGIKNEKITLGISDSLYKKLIEIRELESEVCGLKIEPLEK